MTIPCVVLCASKIDSIQRLNLLSCMIQSLLKQTHPLPIWMSISNSLGINLEACLPRNRDLHIHVHDSLLSQFEHYAYLFDLLSTQIDITRTFAIFCDDDDYTHPHRNYFYLRANDDGQYALLATDALLFMEEESEVSYHTLKSCEKTLLDKTGQIMNGHEYFMFCVRISVVQSFCHIIRRFGLLDLGVCDILFGSLLYHSPKKQGCSLGENRWLYAYSSRPKTREEEYRTYHKMIKTPRLLDELERLFQIESWTKNERGYTDIYG